MLQHLVVRIIPIIFLATLLYFAGQAIKSGLDQVKESLASATHSEGF